MGLTRDFSDTVNERAQRDPEFRRAILDEVMELLDVGDIDVAKRMLKYYIDAIDYMRQKDERITPDLDDSR